MKRWERSLQFQVSSINKHTEDLVNKLIWFSKRERNIEAKYAKNPTPELYKKMEYVQSRMADIVQNLSAVEENLFKRFPYIIDLYNQVKNGNEHPQI